MYSYFKQILVLLKNDHLKISHENMVLPTLLLCSKLATLTVAATLATLAVVMCVCMSQEKTMGQGGPIRGKSELHLSMAFLLIGHSQC